MWEEGTIMFVPSLCSYNEASTCNGEVENPILSSCRVRSIWIETGV